MLGILLSALDQTIVGTVMPRVAAQLQGLDRYAWVFTAYMLASTASMPVWGKLSDIYGRKRFYLAGMGLFVLGSMLSGAAQSMNQLIFFRAVQGLGAGAMIPISHSVIGDIFPPAERGKYQGLTGAVFGLASIVGPALGGLITDQWDWRWAFYINLPVGIAAIAVVSRTLPGAASLTRAAAAARRRVDYLGSALLVLGIVPMLLAFTWAGSTYAWSSPQVLGLLLLSAITLVIFVSVERGASEPIFPLSLLQNDIFRVSALVTFLAGAGMFGVIFYIGLFVQGVLGQSATVSGSVLTPTMLSLVAASIVSGQVVSPWGHYRGIATVGLSIAAVGMFLLAGMDGNTGTPTVIVNLVIFGIGLGTANVLFTIIVQNAVDYHVMGVATAALTFFRAIGGTLGTAIFGSFLASTFAGEFFARAPKALQEALPAGQLAGIQPEALLNAEALNQLQTRFAQLGMDGPALLNQLLEAIRGALASAVHNVFLAAALVMAAAAVMCVFLREVPLRRSVRGESPLPADR